MPRFRRLKTLPIEFILSELAVAQEKLRGSKPLRPQQRMAAEKCVRDLLAELEYRRVDEEIRLEEQQRRKRAQQNARKKGRPGRYAQASTTGARRRAAPEDDAHYVQGGLCNGKK
jgi:hypothetical protein